MADIASASGRHEDPYQSLRSSRSALSGNLRQSRPVSLQPSPVSRAEGLWKRITNHLDEEWTAIRSLNLGVKSGTGVVDELLIRRVHTWVQQLHVLIITHETAADAIGKAARQLSADKLQQMQVMLDVIDHEHLADFLRLSVYNVTSPFVNKVVDVVTDKQLRAVRRKREEAKKARAAALAVPPPQSNLLPPYTGPRPGREEHVRFCGFLPEDHPLVQQAYRLYLNRLPPEAPDQGDQGIRSGGSWDPSAGALGRHRYGSAISLADERQAMEAARNKPEELQLWTDIERRWHSTCHTHHRHELLNPLMVSEATPLYSSVPDFKRKQQEVDAEKAVAAQQATVLAPAPSRRPVNSFTNAAPSRQPSMSRSTRTPSIPTPPGVSVPPTPFQGTAGPASPTPSTAPTPASGVNGKSEVVGAARGTVTTPTQASAAAGAQGRRGLTFDAAASGGGAELAPSRLAVTGK